MVAACFTNWQHEDWVKSGDSSIFTDTYNTDWLGSKDVINSSITRYISLTQDRTAGHSLCSFPCHMYHTDQAVWGCEGHFGVSEADVSVDTMPPKRSQFVVKRASAVRAKQSLTAQHRATGGAEGNFNMRVKPHSSLYDCCSDLCGQILDMCSWTCRHVRGNLGLFSPQNIYCM